MAYAHVQTVANNGPTATISSSTAGNLLVLNMFWSGGAGDQTPVVTAGFTAVDTKITDGGNYSSCSWYYQNNAGGITSVGATSWPAGEPGERRIRVSEYSGIATSSALITFVRQIQTSPGTGTDAVTSGGVSVGSQPALIWGVSDAPGIGTALTQGTGFPSRGTDDGGRIEDKRITATGSNAATFTAGSDPGRVHTWMLAFAEPSSGNANLLVGKFGALLRGKI